MREHIMAIHEKIKPIACLLCDYRCVKYGNMNIHRRATHKLNKMPKSEYDRLRKEMQIS